MTIGEAVREGRESKGWTIEDVAERMPRRFTVSHLADIERYADWGSMPASTLYELAKVGLDPIGRMVEAERLAKVAHLLLPDAKWRENPVDAAEVTVDGVWVGDCIGWELRSKRVAGYILDTRNRGEFWVHSGFGGDSEVVHMCRDSGSREAASVVLIESILKGIITLPAECPGVAALLEMEGE